jgi:hypothetical protein
MWNSAPDYYDYRQQTTGFEVLAASGSESFKVTLTGAGLPERVWATVVSYDLLPALGAEPSVGRWFTSEEGKAGAPHVAMISERLAQRRFGISQTAVGKAMALTGADGRPVSATIVGVLPSTFRFLYAADLWIPMRRGEGDGPAVERPHPPHRVRRDGRHARVHEP